MRGHGTADGGMGMLMVIFWIVLFAAVVFLVSGALKGIRDFQRGSDKTQTLLDILKSRYACGEIDGNESKALRQELDV